MAEPIGFRLGEPSIAIIINALKADVLTSPSFTLIIFK